MVEAETPAEAGASRLVNVSSTTINIIIDSEMGFRRSFTRFVFCSDKNFHLQQVRLGVPAVWVDGRVLSV